MGNFDAVQRPLNTSHASMATDGTITMHIQSGGGVPRPLPMCARCGSTTNVGIEVHGTRIVCDEPDVCNERLGAASVIEELAEVVWNIDDNDRVLSYAEAAALGHDGVVDNTELFRARRLLGETTCQLVYEAQVAAIRRRADLACKVCAATPARDGCREHGRGCYVVSEHGGGSDWPE